MKRIVGTTALALVAGITAFGWYGSGQVLYPESRCDTEHYIFCGSPETTGLEYEDFVVRTADGVDIAGWYIPSPGSDRTVVFVHGHGGTIHEGLRYAPALHAAGFNLALFSLRGNMGTGQPYTMGDSERLDARAVVDEVTTRGARSIGIFGFSMGSVTAIGAMADDDRIGAGIFNSPFATVEDQLAHSLRESFGLPAFPLVPITLWMARFRSGADFDEASAVGNIQRIQGRPVFVIHAQRDPMVPFDHGQRIFEAANPPKQQWFPNIDAHVFEWNADPGTAESHVIDFFQSNI